MCRTKVDTRPTLTDIRPIRPTRPTKVDTVVDVGLAPTSICSVGYVGEKIEEGRAREGETHTAAKSRTLGKAGTQIRIDKMKDVKALTPNQKRISRDIETSLALIEWNEQQTKRERFAFILPFFTALAIAEKLVPRPEAKTAIFISSPSFFIFCSRQP